MKSALCSTCPVCDALLSNPFHRRLNRFWSGVSTAPCPSCNTELEYESDLKAKLSRASLVFRLGVIGLIASVALRVGVRTTGLTFDLMIGLSFAVLIVGFLMSATKPDRIKAVNSGVAE